MEKDVHLHKGIVMEVYDADTMTILFDLDFSVYIKEKVRLFGIDTPELRTKDKNEKKAGYAARDFAREILLNKPVKTRTYKKGKFGRYLVEIYLQDGTNFNETLISKGHARPYLGEKKVKWKDWK